MNIVYIHQHFRTPAMGGGTRSYEFARRLVERGHQVDMIAADAAAPAHSQWRTSVEAGVLVHWRGVKYDNRMSFRDRVRAFGDFAVKAARRAAGTNPDLVFATSTPLTVALPGIWAARRNRVPMVFEVRDLWPEAPIAMGALKSPPARAAARALEAAAYRNAKHVVALTPYMADDITRRFPAVRTTVIPNSCDTDLFGTADGSTVRRTLRWLGPDRPLVVYAGTIGHVNNVDYLVDMAAELANFRPDVRIAVIGEGAQASTVRQYAKDSKVLNRSFFMLDPMPKTDVAKWLAAADLGVVTLVNQPFIAPSCPNKAFDTWAAGRPVAVNFDGWITEVIHRTGGGLALPPGEPEKAARQVVEFLDDGERVETARLAAGTLAHGDFSRDRLFNVFEKVLVEAAGSI